MQVKKVIRFVLIAFVTLGLWIGFNQFGQTVTAQSLNPSNLGSSGLVPSLVPPPGVGKLGGRQRTPLSLPTLIKDNRKAILLPQPIRGNTTFKPQDMQRVGRPLAPLPSPRQ